MNSYILYRTKCRQWISERSARPASALPRGGHPALHKDGRPAPRWSPLRHPLDLLPSPMTASRLRATCPKQKWPPQPGGGEGVLALTKNGGGRRGAWLMPGEPGPGVGRGRARRRTGSAALPPPAGCHFVRRLGAEETGLGSGRAGRREAPAAAPRQEAAAAGGGGRGREGERGKQKTKKKIEAKRGGGGSARRTRRGRARRLPQLLSVRRSPAPSPGAVSRGASPSAAARRQRPSSPARPLYMTGKAARLEPRGRAAREGLRRGTAAGPRAPVSLPGPRPVISGRFGRTG